MKIATSLEPRGLRYIWAFSKLSVSSLGTKSRNFGTNIDNFSELIFHNDPILAGLLFTYLGRKAVHWSSEDPARVEAYADGCCWVERGHNRAKSWSPCSQVQFETPRGWEARSAPVMHVQERAKPLTKVAGVARIERQGHLLLRGWFCKVS